MGGGIHLLPHPPQITSWCGQGIPTLPFTRYNSPTHYKLSLHSTQTFGFVRTNSLPSRILGLTWLRRVQETMQWYSLHYN